MTEGRSCRTCKHVDEETCEYIHQKCVRPEGICMNHSKWQPIQKAPSFQVTEEEARKILEVATILRKRGDMEIWIGNLKHAGYIRKSELVELVEEAEKLYGGCVFYDENSVAIQKCIQPFKPKRSSRIRRIK